MDFFRECPTSQKLVDEILSSLRASLLVADVEGQILFAGSAARGVLGFTPTELKGKDLSVLFTPEDLKCLYPNLLYMARREEPFEGELMLKRKNETRFFAFWVCRIWADSAQQRTVMIICIQDIDKLKQREKTLKEANYDDLLRIADGIAHELRNPVVGIAGFAKKLYKSCRSVPEHDKYYGYIINNLKKIEALVREVEFLAHLPGPRFVELPIREVIESACLSYRNEVKERNILFTISVDEMGLFVDADLVTKAFSILIQNAMDAVSRGGRISLRSEMEGNQCKVYVTDNGSGIAPGDMPHIFDPFFSTKPHGAGINLAVVKRIMDIHGGQVTATSIQGQGAEFLLTFPVERRRAIRVSLLEEEGLP